MLPFNIQYVFMHFLKLMFILRSLLFILTTTTHCFYKGSFTPYNIVVCIVLTIAMVALMFRYEKINRQPMFVISFEASNVIIVVNDNIIAAVNLSKECCSIYHMIVEDSSANAIINLDYCLTCL